MHENHLANGVRIKVDFINAPYNKDSGSRVKKFQSGHLTIGGPLDPLSHLGAWGSFAFADHPNVKGGTTGFFSNLSNPG
jgi:hypothetical protein